MSEKSQRPVSRSGYPAGLWGRLPLVAATDPIEPIHDYTIPIPPFKHPPLREDYPAPKKRNRKPVPKEPPEHRDDGHIDEYA